MRQSPVRMVTRFDWPSFVRTLRSERYLDCTQRELAHLLEVSASSVSKWERNAARPQPRHRRALWRLATRAHYRQTDWPKRTLPAWVWPDYDPARPWPRAPAGRSPQP